MRRQLIVSCVLACFCLALGGCGSDSDTNKPVTKQPPLPKTEKKPTETERQTN